MDHDERMWAERVSTRYPNEPGCPSCGGPLDVDDERAACMIFGCDTSEPDREDDRF